MLPGLVTLVELLLRRTLVRLSRCAAMRDSAILFNQTVGLFRRLKNNFSKAKRNLT